MKNLKNKYLPFLAAALLQTSMSFAADYIVQSQSDVNALGLTGGQKNFNKRIIITKSGTYDFKNTLFYWNGSGKCGQPENQPYIMRISATNVTVKNFGYKNAPDGIHIGTADDGQGYNSGSTISNIKLDHITGWACEDAMTTQYGVKDITITNSKFYGNPNKASADKILQLNFADITIDNTEFYDTQVCVMFKGNQNVNITNSYFSGCERGVVGETLSGVLGKIGKGPSTLHSENNVADMKGNWFDWRYFLNANDSKMTFFSTRDVVTNGFPCRANDGGKCTVAQ